MRRIFLTWAAQCPPSVSDWYLLKAYLKKNGWEISKKIELADVVIVYTCAFATPLEDRSIKLIKKVQKEKNRNAQLVVSGCLPAINKARLKRIFKGITIGAGSLQELDKLLNQKSSIREINYVGSTRNLKKNKHVRYPLRIGRGCYGKCNYCAVRFVFGKARSRPILDILREFDIAYNKGYRSFFLVANDAGSYGKDLGISLAHLIDKLCQKHKRAKFSLSHITPDNLKDMLPSLERFIRSGKILFINIPVQSGSNRIIRLMNRSYTINDFKYCVEKLLSYDPSLNIKTDIIVGFPSETEQDFLDTLRLAEWLGRKKIYSQCFTYYKRPNTEASKLPGQIDQKTKVRRLKQLNKICYISYYMLRNKKLFKKLKRKIAA